ncbi:hybrid sensor histidine kinase/response regulator [Roseixanthobacter glucoisosaccharinicivorans]|uniref:hybrid sensor histidine kinase/response regulator n=1 Tax=Roseixanthobacter glucoisosaccharinicivorans TaxID=3119923 RepID=UPI00372CBEA4
MDDLLREFLTETNESLDVADVELVKFEQDPNNAQILNNIFRLVHTMKGTCGFIGLSRLATLAHAAETLMDQFRQGIPVTTEAVDLVLITVDRIKEILVEIEASEGSEPPGSDEDLISQLDALSAAPAAAPAAVIAAPPPPAPPAPPAVPAPVKSVMNGAAAPVSEPKPGVAAVMQQLERALKPGEVSLDELERVFRETAVEVPAARAKLAELDNAKAAATSPGSTAAPAPDAAPPAASLPAVREATPVADHEAKGARAEDHALSVSNQSIRVNVTLLEHLMTMVSELVLTRNQLLEIARRDESSDFKVALQRLSNVTGELQGAIMRTRMQPIGNAWQKLPRIVRDLAQELGKHIELEQIGAETELDRQVLEQIKDPLTHMVRNSADHGLETTEERRRAGKPDKGTIRLSAYHQGGHVIVEISDDGKGLDVARIKAKAQENGLATAAELAKMPDSQVFRFIFAAGFSTAAKITNVSGRGVGMDVVRSNIEVIGGAVDVTSRPGAGCTFTIKIPLTLAIVPALIVEAMGERFALPQSSVVELVRVQPNSFHQVKRLKDAPVLCLREKLLPIVPLAQLLGIADEGKEQKFDDALIVVLQVGNQLFGVVVDAVSHTEEIVVKPMASVLRQLPMVSGSTILGDGRVIMIVDPVGLAKVAASPDESLGSDLQNTAAAATAAQGQTTPLLLIRAGSDELKAVPLSLVTRLEELEANKLEHVNGHPVIQYRGALIPIVYVNEKVKRATTGTQPMLIFSDEGKTMGLVVDEIVDVVDAHLDMQLSSDAENLLGAAIIDGQAAEILDVGHYIDQAFGSWFKRLSGTRDKAGGKLLVVDDSAFYRNLIEPVLKGNGFEVTACGSAREALDRLGGETRFDIIVSDVEMPGMDGFQFAQAVRGDPQIRNVPIIALASEGAYDLVERGRAAGFTDYIAKSDRAGLIAALKEFTGAIHGEAA